MVLLLVLALSVVFPVASHIMDKREHRAEREREECEQAVRRGQAQLQQIDRLLKRGSSAGLPQLSELADDLLGATPTRYSIEGNAPYVPRLHADDKIRSYLAQPGPPYPFVVVWGTTKAGKSRTLAEALRSTFGDDTAVVLPLDGQALAEITRLGISALVDRRPAVVVLDDLDRAGLEALTAEVLDMVRQWAVIAATMTAQRRAEVLTTSNDLGTIARAALAASAGEYELAAETPSGNEKDEAERLYPGETFDGSIAETLVGARELIARYKASFDTNPAGCALMRAAIDVRRAGITRPVTETELRRLFPLYLPAIRIGLNPTAEQFANGIRWATQPVASQVALLRPVNPISGPPTWTVFDHAVTSDEAHASQRRAIPAETWSELIDIIPARDAFAVGLTAFNHHETSAAVAALRKAATSGHAELGDVAAVALGTLLHKEGNMEEAIAAYQLAIDSGQADIASFAAAAQGGMLEDQGDVDGARAAYQFAIDNGGSDQAPRAAFHLGNLLSDQEDVDGARAAYQAAIDSGHADAGPAASLHLGSMLRVQGDVDGARAAYQAAIDSSHADVAPRAAFQLANMLRDQEDVDGARAAYQAAIDSGHPDVGPAGAIQLGSLLREQGDMEEAKAAYQLAIASGHAVVAPAAAFQLENLLRDQEG